MQHEPARLVVHDLSITRGESPLIAGLDFELAAGELAVVTGRNGSGKTSLLRVLAGGARPSAGHVLWDPPADRSHAIAYQGHLDGLKKPLTTLENLEFYRRLWGSPVRLGPLLEELRLTASAHLPVRSLSAGQRRRIGLAMLRLRDACLWVLDEPGTNLDREGRELVAGWLAAHLRNGGLAVVATHAPHELPSGGSLLIEL